MRFFSCPRCDPEFVDARERGAEIRRSRHNPIGGFQNRASSGNVAAETVIAHSGPPDRLSAAQTWLIVVLLPWVSADLKLYDVWCANYGAWCWVVMPAVGRSDIAVGPAARAPRNPAQRPGFQQTVTASL